MLRHYIFALLYLCHFLAILGEPLFNFCSKYCKVNVALHVNLLGIISSLQYISIMYF